MRTAYQVLRKESKALIIVPHMEMIINMMIRESTRPAIAIPRGDLNKPIREKMRPKNQRIKFTIGIQQKTSPNNAIIKPAIPMLFDRLPSTTTVVVLLVKTLGLVTGWGC